MTAAFFWPILGAGVASVILGMIWYHPKVFGSVWMRIANITPEMAERGKKRMPLYAIIGLLAAMVAAWVMTYVGILLGVFDVLGAVELGFWCWLGFTAPPMLGMVLWEQKPFRYYAIVAGYWLVSFIVMALILVMGSQLLTTNSSDSGTIYDTTGGVE